MTSEPLTALMVRRHEALARRDPSALIADYADDCVLESPGWGRLTGRDAVQKTFREFFTAFPDCRFEFGDLLLAGDRVVDSMTIHGNNTGGFLGQPSTGKPFRLLLVDFLTIADRRIVHEQRVYDVGGLMLQLATNSGGSEATQRYRATLEQAQAEHEMKTAAEIQRALMPLALRKGIGFEVAATSRPCRAIGGDFVDYFDLSNGAFAFVLGDVAGKGPAAALLAAVLQGVFTANAHRTGTPASQIAQANDALVRRGIESRFMTAVYAVLTPEGCLTYCNAGHNPPLLVRRSSPQRLEGGGTIVGMFDQATFVDQTVQLEPGDMLVAFSDGITEARDPDGNEFGEERLLSCVTMNRALEPVALLQRVFEAVHEFSLKGSQDDDLTVLVLSYSGNEVPRLEQLQ
jgi:steroid delta-isomerase-like uncharacterized protein